MGLARAGATADMARRSMAKREVRIVEMEIGWEVEDGVFRLQTR